MKRLLTDLRDSSLPMRCTWLGMVSAGAVGAIVGLAVGLHVHAATAWFAMLEIGLPAAIAGGAVGFLTGCMIVMAKRLRRCGTAG
jgi:hypothetical protein